VAVHGVASPIRVLNGSDFRVMVMPPWASDDWMAAFCSSVAVEPES
jgi:hypothetical protein